MLKQDVLNYFGADEPPRRGTAKKPQGAAAKCAKFLDISIAAVMSWNEIIPEGTAYKLEVLTGGALQVDPEIYRRRKRRSRRAVA